MARSSPVLSAEQLPLIAVSQWPDNPALHIEHTHTHTATSSGPQLDWEGNIPSTRSPAARPGFATIAHLVAAKCR
eukprot:1154622-Pyramimonas_sp.AAC.1